MKPFSSLELHGNRVEYFIPGLFALASFMLASVGLKIYRSFQKPVRGLQEFLQ